MEDPTFGDLAKQSEPALLTKLCIICGLQDFPTVEPQAVKIHDHHQALKTRIFGTICELFQLNAFNSCYKYILRQTKLCDRCVIVCYEIDTLVRKKSLLEIFLK